MKKFFLKPLHLSVLVCALFAASSVGAWWMTPRQNMEQNIALDEVVPRAFNDWKELATGIEQATLAVADDGNPTEEQPYDQVIMRTYENSQGERVMLALAYAKRQKQELKIHRPEVCYTAQGFKVLDDRLVDLPQSRAHPGIPARRLLMRNDSRLEAVTYWVRVGADYPRGGLDTRASILRYGLDGKVPDAILVRASTILADEGGTRQGFEQHERFLKELVEAMSPKAATMLVAAAH